MKNYTVLAVDKTYGFAAIVPEGKTEEELLVIDLEDIMDDEVPCGDCGSIHKIGDMERADNKFICKDCLEDYVACDDCGELHRVDDMTTTADDKVVCKTCLDNNYIFCESCEKYYPNDQMTEVDGDWYCEGCLEQLCDNGDIARCAYCEEWHYTDDMEWMGDEYCCDSCYNSRGSDYINDYHDGRPFRFKSLNSDVSYPKSGNMYIGVEHELSNVGEDNIELAETLVDDYDRVCECDSSINDGFEVISDALTFAYWKKYEDLHSYMDECKGAGLYPDDSSGIHVHLSRDPLSDEAVEEMALFVMNNYMKCIKFGRRQPSLNALHYCQHKNFRYLSDLQSHYCAVNLEESSNIELRFFQTTDDADHMWAIIEFCHCLAEVCKEEKEITWEMLRDFAVADGECEHFIEELDNDFECDEIDGWNYDITPSDMPYSI